MLPIDKYIFILNHPLSLVYYSNEYIGLNTCLQKVFNISFYLW